MGLTMRHRASIDPPAMAPTAKDRLSTLVSRARALGIDAPERFQPEELESLLVALGGAQARLPSSDEPLREEEAQAQPAGKDVAPPKGGRPTREPEPYRENPFFVEPPPALPARRGEDAVWLFAVDPETLFASWDVSAATLARVQNAASVLRVFSPDAVGHVDVSVHLDALGWYIRAPQERVRLQAMLGVGQGADFVPVAQSVVVSVPPRRSAPRRAGYRVAVPYDLDRRTLPQGSVRTWMEGGSVKVGEAPGPAGLSAQRDAPPPAPAPGTARQAPPPSQGPWQQLAAVPAPPPPADVATLWETMGPARDPGQQPEVEPVADDTAAAQWIGVVRGSREWEWRVTGPNSSDIVARGQWAWERHIHGIPRAPTGKAAELPSSASLPTSGSLSSSARLRLGGDA